MDLTPKLHHRRNCIWNHTLPDQFRDKLGRQAHKGGHSIPDRADTPRKHWEPNSELFGEKIWNMRPLLAPIFLGFKKKIHLTPSLEVQSQKFNLTVGSCFFNGKGFFQHLQSSDFFPDFCGRDTPGSGTPSSSCCQDPRWSQGTLRLEKVQDGCCTKNENPWVLLIGFGILSGLCNIEIPPPKKKE